jgi:hypothetical protein
MVRSSFDHFVGAGEQRGWHGQAERPGGLRITGRFEFNWPPDGQMVSKAHSIF